MTETEAAIALGDAYIRYLSAKKAQGMLAKKGAASAIVAICDNEPQKYDAEESKRIEGEMVAAQEALAAAARTYVQIRPQSVPKQIAVSLDADQESAVKAIDQVASMGMRL